MAGQAEKRGPRIGDAQSLWNFTPSPGWTKEEAQVLKLCLMKYGVGRWVQILDTGLLPNKLIQQLNGQTQRLIGQQSLAAYTGLQVDIDRIRTDNEDKTGVERKAGLIIYSGPNATKHMKEEWQREAKKQYGLTPAQLKEVEEQLEEVRAGFVTAKGQDHSRTANMDDRARAAQGGKPNRLPDWDLNAMSKPEKVALLMQLRALTAQLRAQLAAARRQKVLIMSHHNQAADAVEAAAPGGAAHPAIALPSTEPSTTMAVDPTREPEEGQDDIGPPSKPAAMKGNKRGSKSVKLPAGKAQKVQPVAPKPRSKRPSNTGTSTSSPAPKRVRKTPAKYDAAAVTAMEAVEEDAEAFRIGQLQGMGFSTAQARDALEECGNDLESAIQWLLINTT